MTIDINQLEMRSSLTFLLILLAVHFTTFWHCHRIMTHFWPPAVVAFGLRVLYQCIVDYVIDFVVCYSC